MKLSEANIGDRVKIGITKEGNFPRSYVLAYKTIEVVIAGRRKDLPNQTYIVWEKRQPEFECGEDDQGIWAERRKRYRISNKFQCGYHLEDTNAEVELIKAAPPPSSSMPLLLACIGIGATLSKSLSPQIKTNNQQHQAGARV